MRGALQTTTSTTTTARTTLSRTVTLDCHLYNGKHIDIHTITLAMASAAGASRWQSFINHPAGPRTVFFWAPLMKWCLVAAGVKDLSRPADKLSVSQNVALACTGMIWVRYSLVITPVNYSLAAVNFFVGTTGLAQLYRIWDHQRQVSGSPIADAAKGFEKEAQNAAKDIKSEAKAIEQDVKQRV